MYKCLYYLREYTKVPYAKMEQSSKLRSDMYIFNAILRNKQVHRISIVCLWHLWKITYLPIAIDSRNYERMNSILAESFGRPLPSFKTEQRWLGLAGCPFFTIKGFLC